MTVSTPSLSTEPAAARRHDPMTEHLDPLAPERPQDLPGRVQDLELWLAERPAELADPAGADVALAVRAFLAVSCGRVNRPPRSHERGRSSGEPVRPRRPALELPCLRHDPNLWFAEAPADLERAKDLCAQCPIRLACLAVAVDHAEFAGVWGGHIFDRGRIVPKKRPRGRPRKHQTQHSVRPDHAPAAPKDNVMKHNASVTLHHGSAEVQAAAARLYDAECALHNAHQTHVDAWIDAANRKLHAAVTDYLAAATPSEPAQLTNAAG